MCDLSLMIKYLRSSPFSRVTSFLFLFILCLADFPWPSLQQRIHSFYSPEPEGYFFRWPCHIDHGSSGLKWDWQGRDGCLKYTSYSKEARAGQLLWPFQFDCWTRRSLWAVVELSLTGTPLESLIHSFGFNVSYNLWWYTPSLFLFN